LYDEIAIDNRDNEYHDYKVILDKKMGYISMNGELLLEPKYDDLIACGYPRDRKTPYGDSIRMNFLLKNNNSWSLLGSDGVKHLENIFAVNDLWDSYYLFKVNGKWGLYDVISREWGIAASYDTIKYLKQGYRKQIQDEIGILPMFCAKSGSKTFVINQSGEVIETDSKVVKSLLGDLKLPIKKSNIPVANAMNEDFEYRDVRTFIDSQFDPNLVYKSYSTLKKKIERIELVESGKRIGLKINFNFRVYNLAAEYDSIKFTKTVNTYPSFHFLVSKNGKWGVFDVESNSISLPIIYDQIEQGEHMGLFTLINEGKVGLFYSNQRTQAKDLIIEPIYESYVGKDWVEKIDAYNKSIRIYFFMKEGKLCPVCQSGALLYKN
jgi:hypothetical protein